MNYGKSINNIMCIGKCYDKNETAIHPITTYPITSDKPFCPIKPFVKNGKLIKFDECDINIKIQSNDLNNIALPFLPFENQEFLNIYNIYSFEDAIILFNKEQLPKYSRRRIINCCWIVYGNQLSHIDENLAEFIKNEFKLKHNISDIQQTLMKYINNNKNQNAQVVQ